MHFTIIVFLACQALCQDERHSYSGGDSDINGEGPSQPAVSILSHHQELSDDGTFKYSFSADNGLQQREAFHPDGSRTGAYSYLDPEGETVLVHYRADRFGFHVLDGSSIPKTPSLAERMQGQQPQNDNGEQGPHDRTGLETSTYEVDEPHSESSTSADKHPSLPSVSPRPFRFEMARAANMRGLQNRVYRSTAQELLPGALAARSDLDSIAADDLSSAASSYLPNRLSGYISVKPKQLPYDSPYASLVRQNQYPVKKGRAEGEVEDSDSNDRDREPAAASDNGDYGIHSGRYDDGSYAHHALRNDDGSYQQHAQKYDDGSYDKYARMYSGGQLSEPSRHYDDEDVGRAEYEAGYARQPEEEVFQF